MSAEPSELRCRPQDLMLATRQLSFLLQAGVPLINALEVVQRNQDGSLGECWAWVQRDVLHGQRLSVALTRHPLIFPLVYQVMVRIGESTGGLTSSLDQLGTWLESDLGFRSKVVRALTYPSFVLVLSVALAALVVCQVLPPFLEMFRQSGVPLPWPTRLLMFLCALAGNPLAWLLGGTLAAAYALLMRRRLASEEGACEVFDWIERVPLLGWMMKCAGLARWSAALESLLMSGVDLCTSLRLAGRAAGDPRLGRDGREAARWIEGGDPLSDYLLASPLYPSCLGHLVAAGEEASRVPAMLGRCAEIYSQELDSCVELLGAALEPLLLTLVAGMVAFVLLAVFLPMYSLVDRFGS